MLGFVIGVSPKGSPGKASCIRSAWALVDGYAACSAQYLPFCF